ncbi:hypothetical protein D1007_41710 [Hordeum vulgare]|nr:hypothetical protein D1007_41710 [Hordeum vulgare]
MSRVVAFVILTELSTHNLMVVMHTSSLKLMWFNIYPPLSFFILTNNIIVSSDTTNNDAYLVNKSFTIWHTLPDEEIKIPGCGTGTGRAPQPQARRFHVASINNNFFMNIYYEIDKAVPSNGLVFAIAPLLDEPRPGNHGGFLSLTNVTLQSAGLSKKGFVVLKLNTFN